MKNRFEHKFKDANGKIDVFGINGYAKALTEVLNHIRDETWENPGKSTIEITPLLDKILQANKELTVLSQEAGLTEIRKLATL